MGKAFLIFIYFNLIFFSGIAQDILNPSRIVIYSDGARITQKGILRFSEKKARFIPAFFPLIGTIEVTNTEEYTLSYLKLTKAKEIQPVPAKDFADVLEASIGNTVNVTFQIGNEYDEISGEIKSIDRNSGLFILKNKSSKDFFIPIDQVRQIGLEDSLAVLTIKREVEKNMIEIGIDKELQFGSIEMTGTIDGISWSPNCRIRFLDGKTVKFTMGAFVQNQGKDIDAAEFELAPGPILAEGGSFGATSFYNAGKLSLKKGEGIFLNIAETEHEYTEGFFCNIPWKSGPGPETRSQPFQVNQIIKFATPVSQAYACDKISIIGIEGKHFTEIFPSSGEISQIELGNESAVKVVYQEAKDLASSKTIKQGENSFTKMKLNGKVVVSNLKSDPISLRISREISGEILNSGNAIIEPGEKPGIKILTWTILVRGGQNDKVEYEYETLIPQE